MGALGPAHEIHHQAESGGNGCWADYFRVGIPSPTRGTLRPWYWRGIRTPRARESAHSLRPQDNCTPVSALAALSRLTFACVKIGAKLSAVFHD